MPFFVGVDLGQATDYTALVVVESKVLRHIRTEEIQAEKYVMYQPIFLTPDGKETSEHPPVTYAVRHLERMSLGTSYSDVIARIQAVQRKLPYSRIAVDGTGVGRAIIDLLRRSGVDPDAITITAGDSVTSEGGSHRVPKRDLVGTAQVLLQTRRLKIAKGLPHADLLVRELRNFKVKIDPATAHDSYAAWREGEHDDLVLALTVALWIAERDPGIPGGITVGRSVFGGGPSF